ncbi:hypothetical protein Tco_0713636, partial [Tanacetum coccineum]
ESFKNAFEHAYWKATSVPPLDPSPSSTTNKVEVLKEFPTVSMVNTNLKELERHLVGFDQEVDINKKTENRAKMTKLSMEWKRL